MALTGAEARDAVTHAKELSEKLRELNTLEGPELETQTTSFKVVRLSEPSFYVEVLSATFCNSDLI